MTNSPPKLHLNWNSANKIAHKEEYWIMLNGSNFRLLAPQLFIVALP